MNTNNKKIIAKEFLIFISTALLMLIFIGIIKTLEFKRISHNRNAAHLREILFDEIQEKYGTEHNVFIDLSDLNDTYENDKMDASHLEYGEKNNIPEFRKLQTRQYKKLKDNFENELMAGIIIILLLVYPSRFIYYSIKWSIKTLKS